MTDSVETIRCTNCERDILSSNFVVHDIHCQRNIYLCPKCNEPVNKSQKSQHEKQSHSIVYCTSCHVKVEKYLLSDHQSNDCPHRKVRCQICEIEVGASNIAEHENYCGARTDKCLECGKFVMLKYQKLHIDSNHTFIKLSDEPGPSPSWQNGRRTLGQFLPDVESIKHISSPSSVSSSSSNRKKKSHKSDSSKRRLKESPSFPISDGDQLDFPDLNRKGRRSFTARESDPVEISSEGHKLKRRLSGGVGWCKNKSHAENESVWRKGGLYQSDRVTRDEFENAVISEVGRKGEKNSKTRPSGSSIKLTRSNSSTSTSSSTFAAAAASTATATATAAANSTATTPSDEKSFNHANSATYAEDSDLALALQINEELNGDFRLSSDQFVSQAMDENAAVLSRFNLFDDGAATTGEQSRQRSRTPPSKPRLTCYADDSSDDEFLLYSKEPDEDFDDTALPCQFCGSVFPPHALMPHQKNCSVGLHGSDKCSRRRGTGAREKEALVPCGICYRLIPFSRYKTHQVRNVFLWR